jgi:hypothetical protein
VLSLASVVSGPEPLGSVALLPHYGLLHLVGIL